MLNHRRWEPRGLAGLGMLLLALVLAGCAAMQPLPDTARTGDTVSLAMNGAPGARIVKQEDIAMHIIDASGASYPLTLRDFFRVYSDPTSAYAVEAGTSGVWGGSPPTVADANPAHDGQWIGIVDLTDSTGTPLPLVAGAATIYYTWPGAGTLSTPLTILPGTGAPNPLNGSAALSDYHPLETLEPMSQIEVAPTGTPSATVAGGEFTFSYVTADFGNVAQQPRAVSPVPGADVVYSRQDAGNGNTLLTVLVTNPHGFIASPTGADIAGGTDSLSGMAFAVVWDKSLTNITDSNWNTYLTLKSSQYVGLDGTPITGLTTTVTKTR